MARLANDGEALPRDAKGRSVEFCGPEDLGGLRGVLLSGEDEERVRGDEHHSS